MKGYITNSKCYIFPQEAAQIPEVEADVIYVQEENYAAWVAANESLADKLVKYNYYVMTVKEKEWAGHTDDDLEPAQKEDPELSWSEDAWTVTIGADDNIYPELRNPHNVTVSYSSSDSEKASIDASTGEVTLVAEGDTTISAIFAGDDTYEAQTVTYTLTVQAAEPETYSLTLDGTYSEGGGLYVTVDDEPVNEFPCDVTEGATVKFESTVGDPTDYEWDQQLSVDGDGIHYIVMPAEDVSITINYNGAVYQTPQITWAGDYSELVNDTYYTEAAAGTDLLFTALEGVDLYNDYDCSVVEDVSGDAVQLYAPTSETNGVGFIMPDADVTITISPKNL